MSGASNSSAAVGTAVGDADDDDSVLATTNGAESVASSLTWSALVTCGSAVVFGAVVWLEYVYGLKSTPPTDRG